MGKPYPNKNGFTLVEMLVVLLIVSMLGFGLSTKMHSSLYVFMKNLQTLCITAQEKAYVKHRKVYVEIGDSIYIDEVEYGIPHDMRVIMYLFTTMPRATCLRLCHFIVKMHRVK